MRCKQILLCGLVLSWLVAGCGKNESPDVDARPPASVADLAVTMVTASSANLTWTAPGDDSLTGRASNYDIRYASDTITEGNWANAAQCGSEPTPADAGTAQSFIVRDLHGCSRYHFGMKVGDDQGNWSNLSNDASGALWCYVLEREWGSFGSGPGQFNDPRGIALDSKGDVYVVDRQNNRIQKFSSNGEFLLEWGTHGAGQGQFIQPMGVAVDVSDDVYVTDNENHRVQKFDSEGGFIAEFGGWGQGGGKFKWPWGVTMDDSNYVYVTDGTNSIQKFSSGGSFVMGWSAGEWVTDIAADGKGHIYVRNCGGPAVREFTTDGTFVSEWGDVWGHDYGEFNCGMGIGVDGSGNIYATTEERIQKFAPDGTFITAWSREGVTWEDAAYWLGCLAIDGSGAVYVTYPYSHSVQKFRPVPPVDNAEARDHTMGRR